MYRIAHLSDIHFGDVKPGLPERLAAAVNELKPSAVAVSGDITQRARSKQFREARAFLKALPQPLFISPGNHDVPLYNIAARFLWPLRGYQKYIAPLIAQTAAHEIIEIIPIDTTRSFTIEGGRISTTEFVRIREAVKDAPPDALKVALVHQPVAVPPDVSAEKLLQNADQAVEKLADIGIDVILSGHTHRSYVKIVGGENGRRQMLTITAGSALSERDKSYGSSFFLLETQQDRLKCAEYRYLSSEQGFSPTWEDTYLRPNPGAWAPLHQDG